MPPACVQSSTEEGFRSVDSFIGRFLLMLTGVSSVVIVDVAVLLKVDLRQRHSFFEFSVCLFRACLGKLMHVAYKWRKKWRFFTGSVVELRPDELLP